MVVEGDIGKVGVGKLEVRDVRAIDLELELIRVREHIQCGTIRRGQVLDGMVEVELLHLRARRDRLLDLGDEHVLGLTREHLPLLGVEVRVVGVDIPPVGRRRGTPGDAELDVVVLEGDEGERRLPVLAEGEAEGVETLRRGTGVDTTRDRLGGRGRREGWGDAGRVVRVLLIHDLTTDEELNLGDHIRPSRDGLGLGACGVDRGQVDIV